MKNLVTLTPEQDKRYEQLFALAASGGLSDAEADEEAWAGLCEEWPELAAFDGCKP